MYLWLLVGLGGFIGAILRHWVCAHAISNEIKFPLGTLVVNFLGSFLLSLILYLSTAKGFVSAEMRGFLTIGILGSFTTMSTFSYETFRLFEQKEFIILGANLFGTIALTLLAIYLGKNLALGLSNA